MVAAAHLRRVPGLQLHHLHLRRLARAVGLRLRLRQVGLGLLPCLLRRSLDRGALGAEALLQLLQPRRALLPLRLDLLLGVGALLSGTDVNAAPRVFAAAHRRRITRTRP
jgi:hypothetical protein